MVDQSEQLCVDQPIELCNLIADPHVIDRIYIVKCGAMLINKKNTV
jgi:hypothetical protein